MRKAWLLVALISGLITVSCRPKENTGGVSEAHKRDDSGWVEMDAFHIILAEAFHPFKDSANLVPARKLADKLEKEAINWTAAPLPERVNNDEMKARLNQLQADSQALAALIRSGGPEEDKARPLIHYTHIFIGLWELGPEANMDMLTNNHGECYRYA